MLRTAKSRPSRSSTGSETVALVGESGSGKTTLSRCAGGLRKGWTGSIAFEGSQLGHGSRGCSAAERDAGVIAVLRALGRA